jgi:hypothetical protein
MPIKPTPIVIQAIASHFLAGIGSWKKMLLAMGSNT